MSIAIHAKVLYLFRIASFGLVFCATETAEDFIRRTVGSNVAELMAAETASDLQIITESTQIVTNFYFSIHK
jgi:hypothetical protein